MPRFLAQSESFVPHEAIETEGTGRIGEYGYDTHDFSSSKRSWLKMIDNAAMTHDDHAVRAARLARLPHTIGWACGDQY
jgi:hypothetical protein